jgi:transcriptional regulator GlxA family with amidase domain
MLCAMGKSRHLHLVPPAERRDPYVAHAVAAMKTDPARRWTVAAMGRIAGLSRAAFARRFTQALGLPPLRWLAEHRAHLARARLMESDVPLGAIAVEVGYRCEFAFAKAFKRLVGLAPGVFRRRARLAGRTAMVSPFRAAA